MMVDLRTYVFLDSLQPQMASYISSISRGFLPVTDQACCVIEIAPGIEINRLTDVALKATNVMPGLQVVERAFGILEIHSDDQGDVRRAGEDILMAIDQTEDNRIKPKILTSQLVKNLTDHHCQMINRTRYGQMLIRGDTLYILEVESAGYAYFAANEAEKASHIKIVDVKGIGKFGRVYIAGDEADVVEAKLCIEDKLAGISGRDI
ncbi:MAG: hypothetical protein HOD92_12555 [Deltaproteobacteria bacterium]|nr:hypothetical protein [Deltaproteobacteria bacterium]